MTDCARCSLPLVTGAKRCFRCGEATQEAPELIDGRYRIERVLGAGAMGIVYLARDIHLDRRVALKMITHALLNEPTAIERFRREATALASIRNQHVVQIHTFGECNGSYFFAMEHIEGESLEAIIDTHNEHATHVPLELALSILRRVADGVDALHRVGQIHRDVKPGNIVVERATGRAVVLDLGLVRTMGAGTSSKHTGVVGSPPYIAPEQISGERGPVRPQTDVYSLGCTAFELLTGRVPFVGPSPFGTMMMHVSAPRPDLSEHRPDLRKLDPVVHRAMAVDPGERFHTCLDFADALVAAARLPRRSPSFDAMPAVTPHAKPPRDELVALIADDDPMMRATIARALRLAIGERRLRIVTVGTGDDAVVRAIEAEPDLIVLDHDMPGITGVEALTQIRSTPRVESTPAIIVTGAADESTRWKFTGLGVVEIVAKPIRLELLVSAIGAAVSTRDTIAFESPAAVRTV